MLHALLLLCLKVPPFLPVTGGEGGREQFPTRWPEEPPVTGQEQQLTNATLKYCNIFKVLGRGRGWGGGVTVLCLPWTHLHTNCRLRHWRRTHDGMSNCIKPHKLSLSWRCRLERESLYNAP